MTISANLSLRIMAILLGGFVLLQLLIVTAITLPGQGDERRPYNLPLPAQARAMAETLESAPATRREGLIETFNDSLYSVTIVPSAPAIQSELEEDLARLRASYVAALPGRTVAVSGNRPLLRRLLGSRPRSARFFAPVTVTVGLSNGAFMVLDSRPSSLIRSYLRSRSVIGAAGGVILLVALMLAVRQTTRPLVRLSRGVRRFALNLAEPDLPVTGPREVRDVAQAFNEMKLRIAGLIEERTRVLAAIAHDMRTYLTRLRLRAEFIGDEPQRARAVRDLDEMSALLSDTLLLAAQAYGNMPPAEPLDVSAELIALVTERRDLGEQVNLVCSIAEVAIEARRTGFRRILSNLIDNGLRHGSRVSITAAIVGNRVVITVIDDGPGVPADALARLGEPFHRLDPSRDRETGGAGLGLAIVCALATRDSAEIAFANREGGGLQVTLSFALLSTG